MDDIKELYPVRLCEHEIQDGLVVVLFKNTKPSFIERIFFKKLIEKPYKIDLDEVGSFIWHLCEGNRSIADIMKVTHDEFGENIEPVEDRVTQFIKQMHKTKLIQLYKKVS